MCIHQNKNYSMSAIMGEGRREEDNGHVYIFFCLYLQICIYAFLYKSFWSHFFTMSWAFMTSWYDPNSLPKSEK